MSKQYEETRRGTIILAILIIFIVAVLWGLNFVDYYFSHPKETECHITYQFPKEKLIVPMYWFFQKGWETLCWNEKVKVCTNGICYEEIKKVYKNQSIMERKNSGATLKPSKKRGELN